MKIFIVRIANLNSQLQRSFNYGSCHRYWYVICDSLISKFLKKIILHFQIIHLKRFNFVNNKWVKSQKVVNFPLDNFDPTLFLASIPQETIFRHRELLELKAKNIKNVDCNEEIKEFDLENDIPISKKTDCDNNSKTDAQEESDGINELCSSKDINRGFKPTRKRLISTSLTKTPVVDHELVDYNNHKLTEASDPFDLKYKLYAVIVSSPIKLKQN